MSWVFVGLLACAVVVLVAAEWPRLGGRVNLLETRRERERARRKRNFRVVRPEPSDTDEFAASVQRDLAELPTIDERD